MKRFCFLIILFCASLVQAQDISGDWSFNYKEVLAKAKKNKKPVLVYFSGSDWCGPCKKLKKDFFEAEDYQGLLSDYNLLYVDIPQNRDIISEEQYSHNKDLLSKLNPAKSFPALFILDKKGRNKKKMTGYSGEEQLVYYVDFLKK